MSTEQNKVKPQTEKAWCWYNLDGIPMLGTLHCKKAECEKIKAGSKWAKDMMVDLVQVEIRPLPQEDDKEPSAEVTISKLLEVAVEYKTQLSESILAFDIKEWVKMGSTEREAKYNLDILTMRLKKVDSVIASAMKSERNERKEE